MGLLFGSSFINPAGAAPTPAPPPPDPLNLSIAGTPTTWHLGLLPCKQLAFQPGNCSCGCEMWSDAFSRETLGDDWEVISGKWTPAANVGLTAGSDGLVLATRSARTRCHPMPAFWLVTTGTASTVRLYFDYLDSDNHHYLELAWVDDPDPPGGKYGTHELSIYRVLSGVTERLAGPEDLRVSGTPNYTLGVQFASTGVTGEVYVQAMFSVEDELYTDGIAEIYLYHPWCSCVTQLLGNRFGFGATATDYVTDPPIISLARQSDCMRATVEYCALL
jgi:hypothetical protein